MCEKHEMIAGGSFGNWISAFVCVLEVYAVHFHHCLCGTSGSSAVLLQLQSSQSPPFPTVLLLHPLTNEGLPSPFFTVPTATALHSNKTEKGMKEGGGRTKRMNAPSLTAASRVDIVCSHERHYNGCCIIASLGTFCPRYPGHTYDMNSLTLRAQ